MKMNEFKNSSPYTTDDNENQIENISLIKPSSTDHPLYNDVVNACKTVFDPEIPVNIFDLGLIDTSIFSSNVVNPIASCCLIIKYVKAAESDLE